MVKVRYLNVEREVPEDQVQRFESNGFRVVDGKPEDPQGKTSLEGLKLEELKALAKEKGLQNYSSCNKEELLARLEGEADETDDGC